MPPSKNARASTKNERERKGESGRESRREKERKCACGAVEERQNVRTLKYYSQMKYRVGPAGIAKYIFRTYINTRIIMNTHAVYACLLAADLP